MIKGSIVESSLCDRLARRAEQASTQAADHANSSQMDPTRLFDQETPGKHHGRTIMTK